MMVKKIWELEGQFIKILITTQNFWTMYDTLLNFDILNSQNTFPKSRKEALLTVIRKEVVAESPNVKSLTTKLLAIQKIIQLKIIL